MLLLLLLRWCTEIRAGRIVLAGWDMRNFSGVLLRFCIVRCADTRLQRDMCWLLLSVGVHDMIVFSFLL